MRPATPGTPRHRRATVLRPCIVDADTRLVAGSARPAPGNKANARPPLRAPTPQLSRLPGLAAAIYRYEQLARLTTSDTVLGAAC